MRNKVSLCGFILVIMAFIEVLGYTNARYYSAASMTGEMNAIKAIGKISIYHPDWVGGYTGAEDGSGTFDIPQVPIEYANIHYQVTNKADGEINSENSSYYIRIVAEDGSSDLPIEYNVHEYNNQNNVYPLEPEAGYGPFLLGTDSEETVYYSIRANWTSTDPKYQGNVQHLKVQMVIKRIDGTLKVMDEAPLNMLYSGPESNTKVTLAYYLYEENLQGDPTSLGTQTIDMDPAGVTIDFNNAAQLAGLGIQLPDGSVFHDVRHNINGANEYSGTATSVAIPEGSSAEEYYIEVYLTGTAGPGETTITVPVKFYDSSDAEAGSATVEMQGNGTYVFTTDACRELCPALSTMTSFTIYIANQWDSTYEVGNTTNGGVTVDYNATYTSFADFKLKDDGSYIYIKAWW